jgi:glycosyltransferase involved in cell wall biosynthesis
MGSDKGNRYSATASACMDRPLHSLEPASGVSAGHRRVFEHTVPEDGSATRPRLSIMGIRGLPARHGGFETFAARLAPFLVAEGWAVTVYCQEETVDGPAETEWQGVRLVHLAVGEDTAWNSIRFDQACISHALRERPPLVLTLGYNTAVLGLRLRRAGIRHVMNMDGIEWSRAKWGPAARAWLYLNDWAGCLGAHHLIADHPEIARHLEKRVRPAKITTIPYGTDLIEDADVGLLEPFGLVPGGYLSLIARPEPENSILEIVQAFSARPRGVKLLVLGNLQPQRVAYHAKVQRAASKEVVFAGAIFDSAIVRALRLYSLMYLHGHQVGGTNPSLIEAMGAGNPVLAHDNRFNRWVAGNGARYFKDTETCTAALDALLARPEERARLAEANIRRAVSAFRWERVLQRYEVTLAALHTASVGGRPGSPPPASSYDPSNYMDMGP